MKTATRAFSAIDQRAAEILWKGFRAAHESAFPAITIKGSWVRHRFVVVDVTATVTVPKVASNLISLALTLSATAKPEEIAGSLREFGVSVEQLWRESDRAPPELLVSDTDCDRHQVPRFHHVALCGHEAKEWLQDGELGAFAGQVQMCPACTYALRRRRTAETA